MDQPFPAACLDHLLQMVANFFDAHTAALLVIQPDHTHLKLVAWETLSPFIIPHCTVKVGHGLIGWVAKEKRPLHVTQFARDTRTLGIYSQDANIKAFLAVPLPEGRGVIMVDSKNRYAFTEKKQRILGSCAQVALDLYVSMQCSRELDFYRRYQEWVTRDHEGIGTSLSGLVDLFRMQRGLVVWQPLESEELYIRAVFPPTRVGKIREGMVVKGTNGLATWILSHRQGILLARSKVDRQRSFLLYPEETIERGKVVMGFYHPTEDGPLAWILTGDSDIQGLPKGVIELISSSLRDRFCSR